MLNRIVLTGRLTRDPELKRTTSDKPVASFTLAVDDNMKGPNGEKTTTFIGVTVWDNQADNVAKFLRKGSLVGVDGRIRQRTFEKRDGTKASVIEVIANHVEFLEPKGSREIPNEEIIFDDEQPSEPVEESKNLDAIDVADDDLPF
ncbi:MAG: single-stranded DNA-binding protein [Bacilli bacterium]|nr:single-stranded DNA-binding protein [Bacilli bacterium]